MMEPLTTMKPPHYLGLKIPQTHFMYQMLCITTVLYHDRLLTARFVAPYNLI